MLLCQFKALTGLLKRVRDRNSSCWLSLSLATGSLRRRDTPFNTRRDTGKHLVRPCKHDRPNDAAFQHADVSILSLAPLSLFLA